MAAAQRLPQPTGDGSGDSIAPFEEIALAGDAPPLPESVRRLSLSVVVCAYNEERNLPRLLEELLKATGPAFDLVEVLCVASGCTDGTVEVVRTYERMDARVRLLLQPRRLGKAAALAAGLASAHGELVLVENADTLPAPRMIDQLVLPFARKEVALVCARPFPTRARSSFTHRLAERLWEIHHEISSQSPKVGETYLLRNRPFELPVDAEDDDTCIGELALEDGGHELYAAEAVVYLRAPEAPGEFVRQRFRVNRQAFGLWRRMGIRSKSWRLGVLVPAILHSLAAKPRQLVSVAVLALLEAAIRILAIGSWVVARGPVREWPPIGSTKPAIDPTGRADRRLS